MKRYYDGAVPDLSESFALHWFGGHPDSQEFASRSNKEIDKILKSWKIM
jgi:hypothetical protein